MRAAEFVESYFDAWNHRDPQAVAGHLAADGIYCDMPSHEERNRDELIVELGDFFSAFRHRYELIGDILSNRNTIAFQYRMCPAGKVRKHDSANVICGAEFIMLHGDAAISITDYCDIPSNSVPSDVARLNSRRAQRQKYAKSGLSDEQLLEYKSCLDKIMLTQQAYLRSDLTLPKLARAIDCSVNHLSQVINAGFGMSFFDFVNQFRIEHAKGLLSELDKKGGAVVNVAFTVGFNSNSAFYAAFKKYVGQTPAQYRRSQTKMAH